MSESAAPSGISTPAGPAAGGASISTDHSSIDMSDTSTPPPQGGVDVQRAKTEFAMLETSLSRQSHLSRQLTQHTTRDVENQPSEEDDDEFDLVEYLRGVQSENAKAGIKSKHVGVSWTNLEVLGSDSMSLNIRTFPDAITGTFLGPVFKIMAKLQKNRGRKLLQNFTGFAKPGEMVLVVGRPGSGCSTFLKMIANQRSGYIAVNGDVKYGGISHQEFARKYKGEAIYNEEDDVHFATLTVKQTLEFALNLKSPGKRLPHQSIKSLNKEVLDTFLKMLGIPHTADTLVGSPTVRGVSGGERKRVSIGVELAARPDLLLFLDEPTSGLDGQTAYNVVRFLKKLTASGQAILCTIHQPNALLFEQFDRLLLLERGGKTVYFGPIGPNAEHIVEYFAERGAKCPEKVNMAEYMLDAIGAGSMKRVGKKPWSELYRESDLFQANLREIEAIKQECAANTSTSHDDEHAAKKNSKTEYATPFGYQVKTVLRRALLSTWRQSDYQFTRLFQHAAISLITSLCFLNLGNSTASLQYRTFGIFMATVLPAIILAQIEPFFIMSRSVFIREDSSKMYSGTVFAITQLIQEIPFGILSVVVYYLLFYYPAGFQTGSDRAGYFFAMLLVTELFAVTLGQAIAAFSPSIYIASLFNPFFFIIMSLFCGVTIPYPNLPHFYRSFLYWVNPLTYLVSGLTTNELHDLPVVCAANELARFQPPSGQTCRAWAQPFLDAYGGYLSNPDATSDCGYCQYSVGDQFFAAFNIEFSQRGRNIGILIAFVAFNAIATIVASRFIKYANR